MKKILLTTLQDKNSTISEFRKASKSLCFILAGEASKYIEKDEIKIETPIAKADGYKIKNEIVLVPILRSGIAMLEPFTNYFENASVGFVGLQRDEKTAIAKLYYYKLPKTKNNQKVILLDPMIATGGSACDALKILKEHNVDEKNIIFVAIIGAKEGVNRVKKEYPNINIIVSHIDEKLNDKKFIIPGLGDFGDRYFGTLY